MLIALAKRDLRREAVFLWITPFFAALSKVAMALANCFAASSLLPAVMDFLTSFTATLNLSLVRVLNLLRRSACLMAFAADLVFGI